MFTESLREVSDELTGAAYGHRELVNARKPLQEDLHTSNR